MDYSLIVGIYDCTQENKQRNTLPVTGDEEDEEAEEDEFPAEDVGGEDGIEEEENGIGEDEFGIGDGISGAATPPDSPQPTTPVTPFCGDLDPEMECFGIRSSEGMSTLY